MIIADQNSSVKRRILKGGFDMKRKTKSVWCYLDGKKHCDVVKWALAANVTVPTAKKMLVEQYPSMDVSFKII